jgi:uncharacterized protein with von Willebrand factor type A (vWA) domain
VSEEKRYTPAEDYDGLLRQFSSMNTLLICQGKELSYYSKKDYTLSEKRLKELEENLESEKQMNHELTTREQELLDTIKELREALEHYGNYSMWSSSSDFNGSCWEVARQALNKTKDIK